ncbi:MAG: 2-C-methyl-D-erythritol 4-phosphate cytidylyltransferase [Planctomycetota bacterium]|mgnify:CR=1 FL=1|uniref:2-C-methyl-D-erythritol 4-phosphate cytidylyltransferase n=1 Tax=uncultured Gimesia sp. TaxID=1678688 RepID=UPI002635DD2C|nr:2-C-methyl-D-erythritol 4-phosphate cytidylyltransferase [uncultured Gimesia sp.]
MATFAVILAAAGKSTRFQAKGAQVLGAGPQKKPFMDLKGRAVWLRSAEIFANRDDVKQLIISIAAEDIDWFKQKFRPNLAFLEIEIVAGGQERADSVQKALARVKADIDYVAIHDAARPLITDKWVGELFAAAEQSDAVIPAVRISSTLKRAGKDRRILETVDRTDLWAAQTPQVFKRQLLLDAYAQRGDFQPTDEAQLIENLGHPVTIVEGSPLNQKITTAADFRMAEALVNALPKPKGIQALHPFADEEPRGIF